MKKIMLLFLMIFSIMYADITLDFDALNEELELEKKEDSFLNNTLVLKDQTEVFESNSSCDVNHTSQESFACHMVGAKRDWLGSQFVIGNMYFNGIGTKKDYEKAFKWYMKVAELGSRFAQGTIGNMYYEGLGVEQDYKKAFKWYMKAAKQNDLSAQYQIAGMYYNGEGTPQNKQRALRWFTKLAEKGHAPAQGFLGSLYRDGDEGLTQNYKKAIFLFQKAAEQGNALAQINLGKMYYYGQGVKQNYNETFKWFMKAAEKGNADAQLFIGAMYYEGLGVEQDYKKAFKWYMKAAEKGNSSAQYKVGLMYDYGQWATENKKKAFKWFMKAAKQGNLASQSKIGGMYLFGEGIKGDSKEAFKWFMKAAERGNIDACIMLAVMYDSGWGIRKNYKKSFEWRMKAAKKGSAHAQSMIGTHYYEGNGVKKNYIKAYSWISLALASSDESYTSRNDDYQLLNEIERKMTPQQIAIAQSYDPLEENNPVEDKSEKKQIDSEQRYTGTGFFINKSKILTNNHVIKDCKRIELVRKGYSSDAQVTATDSINDLAILEAKNLNSSSLKFRAGKGIRIGDNIIVIGYPLGDLLGSGIKLTTGNISALTGLVDDTTRLQLTAPVQPGNSGGALLDESGNVVGIIVAQLKKGQNVNLAIKANVAQMFLDINNIDYSVDISKEQKITADIAEEAKDSTVQVVCYQ